MKAIIIAVVLAGVIVVAGARPLERTLAQQQVTSTGAPGQAATFFQLDRRISMLIDIQLASQIPLVHGKMGPLSPDGTDPSN